MAENTSFGTLAFLGPVGAGTAGAYFSLEAFYPGGANRAAKDYGNGYAEAVKGMNEMGGPWAIW